MLAQELGRLTAQARNQQFQQADAWVKDTVQHFVQGCRAEAQKGMECYTLREVRIPSVGPCITADRLAERLKMDLDACGFATASVQHYFDFQSQSMLCTLHGSWQVVESPAPTPATGGCSGTCPICKEHQPVVVLVPCGHTICCSCHQQQSMQLCPLCRSAIQTTTNGLFMD
ncbi:ERAD-associated E3 ubiquitin-protein ligase DOA10 [Durusdinium trenchii]|uniref:ERAD-associated E3 ubiquitin-protein ligase DOA10 n=1 Tax=Durusdinium trenchii TaxID=1381693 RepID=A0ABP0NKM3_9DINO